MRTATPENVQKYLRRVVNPEYFRASLSSSLEQLKQKTAYLLIQRDGLAEIEFEEEGEKKEQEDALAGYDKQLAYAAIELERLERELDLLPTEEEAKVIPIANRKERRKRDKELVKLIGGGSDPPLELA